MFFEPGQKVRVERFGGRRCDGEVVYDKGGTTVRVRYESGKVANQERSRVFPVARGTFGGREIPITPQGKAAIVAELAALGVTTASRLVPTPKPQKAGRSSAYLDFVRSHPCVCGCGEKASEAHHFGPRGMGTKTSDYRTVPMCAPSHRDWHARGRVGDLSREETISLFHQEMVGLLVEWLETRKGRAA